MRRIMATVTIASETSGGNFGQLLIVLGQATPSSEPAECSLHHPTPRSHDETGGARDAPHDDQGQTKQEAGEQDRHQVLMLALRFGERALPLTWRVEATAGAIGFETQKALLEAVVPWLPTGATIRLRGDRFYGTADLIGWCQDRNWDY